MPLLLSPDTDVWGAVLLISCFLQAGLVFGALRSYGVFFPEFVQYFGSAAGTVSWVTSCGVAVQQFMSPLGCALALRFGFRPVVMFGGLLSSLGMFFAAFATSLPQLYMSLGGLSGLGWALIFSPSMAAVTQYFSRRRSLATGFVLTGVGVLSFAMIPLVQYLVEVYSWRGALMLLSGLTLHSIPCGALLRPLPGESSGQSQPLLWGWNLLCDGAFLRYCLAITLINAGYFVPFAHLVAHMHSKGVVEQLAALLMSLVGVADVGGRLFAGWLSDLTPRHRLPLVSLWTGLTSVTLGILPLASKPVEMGAAFVAFGFCAGALTPGVFSAIPEVVGEKRVLPAVGLLQMIESVGGLLGAPISGWLCDLTGNFTISFVVSGIFLLLGSFIILTLPGICSRKRTNQSEKSLDNEVSWNDRTNQLESSSDNEQPQADTIKQLDTRTEMDSLSKIMIDTSENETRNDLSQLNGNSQSGSRIDQTFFSSGKTDQAELKTDTKSPSRPRRDGVNKSSYNQCNLI